MTAYGKQSVAEHLSWVEVVRLGVDVDTEGVVEQLCGVCEGVGVEQVARVGKGRLVHGGHLRQDAVGGVVGGKREVDVHLSSLAGVSRVGFGHFDLELLEALEAEFLAKSVHAWDRDVRRKGELLEGETLQSRPERRDGARDLQLRGGEVACALHASLDVHGSSCMNAACRYQISLSKSIIT